MSTTIDNKVVEMQFDNKHFEKNVQTSLKTLDTLKKSLDLTGASKGLENVNVAAKKCNLSPLSNAAETVKVKFSAMEVMAVTALANITNSAVNAGKKIASSLTIEPIRTGFNEYELKMNSVQTIMSATGASLETVNRYLNELNTYSDKTIYSFSDMTQNIAKFVNAGVSLDDSVLAIQGISNEAALAGANANEASRAMYNFSQALSTGYVQRIDWKSIELANMATVGFKEELLESAIAMGTVKKNADGMYSTLANPDKFYNTSQMFIETLDDQWLTTEVLIDTLKEYSDETTELGKKAFAAAQDVKTFSMMMDTLKESAQSGWAATWELLVGDLEEAKQLWTSVTKVVGGVIESTSNARNNFLGEVLNSNWEKFVDKLGEAGIGVKDFEEQLTKTLEAAGIDTHKILKEHETWDKAIKANAVSYEHLQNALDNVNVEMADLSKIRREIKMGSKGDDVKEAQKVLKKLGYDLGEFGKELDGVDGIVGEYTENAIKAFQKTKGLKVTGIIDDETLKALKEANSLTKKLDGSLGGLLKDLDKKGGRELMIEALANAFDRLKDVLKLIGEAWNNVFSPLSASRLYDLISAFHKFTENLELNKTTADNIRSTFEGLFTVLKFVKDAIVGVLSVGWDLVKALFAPLADITLSTTGTMGKLIKRVVELASKGFKPLSKSLEVVISFVETLADFLSDVFVTVVKEVSDAIGEWIDKFKETEFFKGISEAFSSASETISGALDTIKEKMEGFDFGIIGEKLGAFGNWLLEIGGAIKNSAFVTTIIDTIRNAFTSFVDFIKGIKINVDSLSIVKCLDFLTKNNYTGLKGGIIGVFQHIKDNIIKWDFTQFINDTLTKFAVFWNKHSGKIKDAFEKCKEVVLSIVEFIFGTKQLTLPDIMDVVEKFLKVLILVKILGIVGNISGTFSSIGEAFENMAKSAKWRAIGDSFKAMAIALAAFAGCMIIINKMGTKEALKAAGIMAGILIVMGGVVGALLFLSKSLDSGIKLTTAIMSLVGISVSLLILVKALKEIDELALENPGRSIMIMLGMIAALAGALIIVGKSLKGSTLGSAAAILTMLTALKMIPEILSDYAEFDWRGVRQVIPIMIGMLAGLALILRIASGSLKEGAKAGGLALVMLSMVLSLKILMEVIQELGGMDPVKMEQGVKGVLAILGAMTLMMVAINLSSKAYKAGKGEKVITGFAGLATALLGVTAAIWLLGGMDADRLKQGGLAVAAILGVFTIMLSAIGKSTSGSFKIGGLTLMLIGMGVLIAEMGVIVNSLAKIGWKDSMGAAGAMSALLLSLAGSCFIISKAQGKIAKALGTMYLMTPLVIILAGIVGYMSHIDVGASVETASALSILLVSLSAACLVLSRAVFITADTIKIAYAMSGVLAIVAVILGIMASIPGIGRTLELATSLSILLVALSGACLILSRIGPMGTIAAVGATALLKVLGLVSLVLLAVGGLIAAIPGSSGFLDEVIVILEKLGVAIGSFFGGIVGGFIDAAVLSLLPNLATSLSEFMTNLQPFLDGVKSLDGNILGTVGTLAKAILILTAAEFLDAITSGFGGGQNLATFGANVSAFGSSLVAFSDSVSSLTEDDIAKITIAAEAAQALAEVGQAITRTGGVFQDLAGEKNLATFGSTLAGFGEGLVAYHASIADLPKGASEKIIDSAGAAQALADVAAAIPRSGGDWQNFIGEKDLIAFGNSLAAFGECLIDYHSVISDLPDGAVEAITASAGAAQALADVATSLPRTDGMWQDIIGEQDMATFGRSLKAFGQGLIDYTKAISELPDDAATKIENSGTAMDALIAVADKISRTGGWSEAIVGTKDIEGFGTGMSALAKGITDYVAIAGTITEEDVESIKNSKEALNEMDAVAKKVSAATCEKDLGGFGTNMASLGRSIMSYANSVTGLTDDHLAAITKSATAMDEMAKAAGKIPNEGGVAGWLFGDNNNIPTFGKNMVSFASSLRDYANIVLGITDEDVMAVTNSTIAMEAMAKAAGKVPNEGGVGGWLFGDNTAIPTFGTNMVSFATSLMSYAAKVSGITEDHVTAIDYSAEAMSAMAKAAGKVPNEGGVAGWLFGDNANVASFGTNMASFADSLMSYANKVSGLGEGGAAAIEASIPAIDAIASAAQRIPSTLAGFNSDSINMAISALSNLVDLAKKMSGVDYGGMSSFSSALNDLAQVSIDSFVQAFTDSNTKVATAMDSMLKAALDSIRKKEPEFTKNGQNAITKFADGIKAKKSSVVKSTGEVAKAAIAGVKRSYSGFYDAGKYIVQGVANGINANKSTAINAAVSMAVAAYVAACEALGIASPSKAFYEIGEFAGIGFVNALGDYESVSYKAGAAMAESAKFGLAEAIAKVKNAIDFGIDSQPTIRPVLDLSDIRSGAGTINSMFSMQPSVGVLSNANAINSMMNRRQNGVTNSDVVAAIKDLGSKISKHSGDTYSINGITYDDGSNISDAVKTLVRAARVERRT